MESKQNICALVSTVFGIEQMLAIMEWMEEQR